MTTQNNTTATQSSSLLGGALRFGFGVISDTVKLAVKLPVATTAYCVGTVDEVVEETKKACGIEMNLTNSLRNIADTPIDELITNSEKMARDDVKSISRSISEAFTPSNKELEKPTNLNKHQENNNWQI